MGDAFAHLALALVLVPALGLGLIALTWAAAAETREADHRRRGGWRFGPPSPIARHGPGHLSRCATWGPPAPHRPPRPPDATLPEALAPAPTTWAPYGGEL